MLAADPIANSADDLDRILKVRKTRLDAAQEVVRKQRVEVEKAQVVEQEKSEAKKRCEQALVDFRYRIVNAQPHEMLVLSARAGTYCDTLAHTITQAQGEVEKAQAAVVAAQKKLDECRVALKREQGRYDAIKEALRRAQAAQARADLVKEEEEMSEMRLIGPELGNQKSGEELV